jgi:hypothetical protein
MMRFAFLGRVSTEDLQDPVASRQWQLSRAAALVADRGRIVAEFFDVGQSRAVSWLRRPESARLLAALEDSGRGFEAVVIGEPQRVFYDNQFGLVFPLVPDASPAADEIGSQVPHTDQVRDVGSYDTHTSAAEPITASYDIQTDGAEELIQDTGDAHPRGPAPVNRGRSRPRHSASELQRAAWQWAVANRTSAGNLPSGKAIAERFGRRERWGRLVKQTGMTGGFGQKSAA